MLVLLYIFGSLNKQAELTLCALSKTCVSPWRCSHTQVQTAETINIFQLSKRTCYYSVRPIHWTRSPATEATHNSPHLKQRVQTHVRHLWCRAFRRVLFHNNLRHLEPCQWPASAPKISPINSEGKNNTWNSRSTLLWNFKKIVRKLFAISHVTSS